MAWKKIILGIDPSLRATGYAYSKKSDANAFTHGVIKCAKSKGSQRLSELREEFAILLDQIRPDFAVYEDYSFGSKGRTHGIAELGGVFRLELYERCIDTLFVPPKSLKLFTTNDGNADKYAMVAEIKRKYGLEEALSHDEADAIALWYFARCYLCMERTRTTRKRIALNKCKIVKGMKVT